jgi:glycosyltransferase XagB
MVWLHSLAGDGRIALIGVFLATQIIYLASMLLIAFFYTRPVDLVKPCHLPPHSASYPPVVLFYPVLRELEETMRTTFYAIDKIDYPRNRYRIVAIPNSDDYETIASLQRLQATFAWLEILPVPPTSDASWNIVWARWESNPNAYWWHEGKRAGVWRLPPKKTRQLIYAFYSLCPVGGEDTLISYIDADSAPPPNYFLLGAAGSSVFDVVQLTNVAGNLLTSWATSFHAFDHMCWDISMYPHMTSHGRHPYYVLGKGLFFRSSDLHAFGGFHPWLTIEDPEVGMRLWTNGRRLGVVAQPLVEEVPRTFRLGVIQRKRWVCGFFQSLASPVKQMGMTGPQRLRARLNLVPCLALLINPVGMAVGLSVLVLSLTNGQLIGRPLVVLAAVNVAGLLAILGYNWANAWRASGLVLDSYRDRVRFAIRVNPFCVLLYWLFWCVSIVIGIQMFFRDKGLVWERTEKVDANHDLVRAGDASEGALRAGVVERSIAISQGLDLSNARLVSDLRSATARSVANGPGQAGHPYARAEYRETRPRHRAGRHRLSADSVDSLASSALPRGLGSSVPRGLNVHDSVDYYRSGEDWESKYASQRSGLEVLYDIGRRQDGGGPGR